VHFLRRLGRVGKIIAQLILKLLLVFRLFENVPAIVQDLSITIEEDAVDLSLPRVESLIAGIQSSGFQYGYFGSFK